MQMPAAYAALDKLDRDPREVLEQRLGAAAGVSASIAAQLFELAGATADEAAFTRIVECRRRTAEWDNLRRYLDHAESLGVREWVQLDLSIVRGLAYYTGIVFELFDAKGELRAICGGGRYDTLLESLGGVSLPALGFGMGDVVLGELLRARGKMPDAEASGGRVGCVRRMRERWRMRCAWPRSFARADGASSTRSETRSSRDSSRRRTPLARARRW